MFRQKSKAQGGQWFANAVYHGGTGLRKTV